MNYPLNFTYNDQTRRLALDDVTVSTGDIDSDKITLRTMPTAMRGETFNMIFRVRVPSGKGKVEYPAVPLAFEPISRRWVATIPKEVLEAVTRDQVSLQLRVGEGKHYFSFNTVLLTVSKAIVTK